VGDPGRRVGGGDRGVENGPPGWGEAFEHDGDQGVQEQPAPGQGVATLVAYRQVEGVDPDAGGTELEQPATDMLCEVGVLVVGVDHRDVHALVEVS
jgi:hypothetical protein